MNQLDHNSWVAEIICNVEYSGSAIGKLNTGSYLIIRKPDNSISIHAGDKNLPRNYLRATTISYNNEHKQIICTNKKERITITIDVIKWIKLLELSTSIVAITNSEKQLIDKFISVVGDYIENATPADIVTEFQLPGNGKVDILIKLPDLTWIIEAKRKKITQKCISQVLQYKNHAPPGRVEYAIFGPSISKNALTYANQNCVKYINFEH